MADSKELVLLSELLEVQRLLVNGEALLPVNVEVLDDVSDRSEMEIKKARDLPNVPLMLTAKINDIDAFLNLDELLGLSI